MRRIILAALAMCTLVPCAAQPDHQASPGDAQITLQIDKAGKPTISPEQQQVLDGLKMIQSGQIKAALDGPLTDVVNKFEAQYANSNAKIYSARGMTDALVYATQAASTAGGHKVDVLGPAWAMAYWARGYAYGEMARDDDERVELEKALALAPLDAQYNNELAYVYMQKRDWTKALDLYRTAEAYADLTAADPAHAKCVSFRGQGYVLVELHRLDEAEAKYRACLAVTPN
ncbi:MAG TPA: hypothetical protein VGI53_06295, partial [Dyella sp.]